MVFSGTDSVKCGGRCHVAGCQHVLWEPGKKDRKFHKSFNRFGLLWGTEGSVNTPFSLSLVSWPMYHFANVSESKYDIALFELLTFI